MYLDYTESITLAESIRDTVQVPEGSVCTIFPNTLAFVGVHEILKDTDIRLGAQNVSWVPRGAYTGATSTELFRSSGASYALVGHSERRYIFGETDEASRKKLEACLEASITPVVCIGETTEDRADMKAEYRVKKQIMKLFEGLTTHEQIIVAYEPVWAIGTGKTASPEQAQEVHAAIRALVAGRDEVIAAGLQILYGGSVKAQNAGEIFVKPDIDGGLVGGASLVVDDFLAICQAASR